jgi:hypothetical protein
MGSTLPELLRRAHLSVHARENMPASTAASCSLHNRFTASNPQTMQECST